MPRRLTNLWLAALLVALTATGVLGWVLPVGSATPLYDAHRLLGVALLLSLGAKAIVARASLRRRLRRPSFDRTLVAGALASAALLASLALGVAWTAGIVSFDALGGYSPLNLHVFLALALLPAVAWHVARRWEARPSAARLLRRRALLRLAGLTALSVAAWALLERAVDLRLGGLRAASGSKHAGSFTGNAFPLTSWFLDATQRLAAEAWRLEVAGAVREPRSLSYAELRALPRVERDAVLDCTAGWWSEQRWSGPGILDVLATTGISLTAREATVISATGHRWTFPLEDLREALLATHVGAEVLSAGHGFPARLVVPGRRGFQWVKWVSHIEVS